MDNCVPLEFDNLRIYSAADTTIHIDAVDTFNVEGRNYTWYAGGNGELGEVYFIKWDTDTNKLVAFTYYAPVTPEQVFSAVTTANYGVIKGSYVNGNLAITAYLINNERVTFKDGDLALSATYTTTPAKIVNSAFGVLPTEFKALENTLPNNLQSNLSPVYLIWEPLSDGQNITNTPAIYGRFGSLLLGKPSGNPQAFGDIFDGCLLIPTALITIGIPVETIADYEVPTDQLPAVPNPEPDLDENGDPNPNGLNYVALLQEFKEIANKVAALAYWKFLYGSDKVDIKPILEGRTNEVVEEVIALLDSYFLAIYHGENAPTLPNTEAGLLCSEIIGIIIAARLQKIHGGNNVGASGLNPSPEEFEQYIKGVYMAYMLPKFKEWADNLNRPTELDAFMKFIWGL